jgi:cob(I)alamin adenosyltransferase
LVILDEINTAVSFGMLKAESVEELLRNKPEQVELVLTGRGAPKSFYDLADLVTDMTMVSHYFYHGVSARNGIDF